MRIRRPLLVAAVAGAALAASAVVAIGAATRTVATGTAVTGVKVVRETNGIDIGTGLNSWVNIPGANANVTIPSGQTGFFLLRFSSPTKCDAQTGTPGTQADIVCWVRVLVNGTPALPTTFWEGGTTTSSPIEAHSLEYSTNRLAAGTYTVQVQVEFLTGSGSPSGGSMQLNGFQLSVMTVR